MGKATQGKRERSRSTRTQRPQITERRKWTKEEDNQLQQSIQKYGTKNWCVIAANIPDRHPKQCRERWINHLDPQITKGKISEAEWEVVLNNHVKQGNRWSEIAKLLPGRTPNQIKNYWHTMMRRSQRHKRDEEEPLSDESVTNDYEVEEQVDEDKDEQPMVVNENLPVKQEEQPYEQPIQIETPQQIPFLLPKVEESMVSDVAVNNYLPVAEPQNLSFEAFGFNVESSIPSLYSTEFDQAHLPWDFTL